MARKKPENYSREDLEKLNQLIAAKKEEYESLLSHKSAVLESLTYREKFKIADAVQQSFANGNVTAEELEKLFGLGDWMSNHADLSESAVAPAEKSEKSAAKKVQKPSESVDIVNAVSTTKTASPLPGSTLGKPAENKKWSKG